MNTQRVNILSKLKQNDTALAVTIVSVFGLSVIFAGLAFDRAAALMVMIVAFGMLSISYSVRVLVKSFPNMKKICIASVIACYRFGVWLDSPNEKAKVKAPETRLDKTVKFSLKWLGLAMFLVCLYKGYEIKGGEGALFVCLSAAATLVGLGVVHLLGNLLVSFIKVVGVLAYHRKQIAKSFAGFVFSSAYISTTLMKAIVPLVYTLFLAYVVKFEGAAGASVVAGLFLAKIIGLTLVDAILTKFKSKEIVTEMINQNINQSVIEEHLNSIPAAGKYAVSLASEQKQDMFSEETSLGKAYSALSGKGFRVSLVGSSTSSTQRSFKNEQALEQTLIM